LIDGLIFLRRPWEEDTWKAITIGSIPMTVVKPCDRCAVPTVQANGKFHPKFEPRKTLLTFRAVEDKVYFGQNLVHHVYDGEIKVGDTLLVHSTKPADPAL
jgi:uncharacterized protein YcbX